MKQGFTPTTPTCCPSCGHGLDPIGNFSYGPTLWADRIRRYWLIIGMPLSLIALCCLMHAMPKYFMVSGRLLIPGVLIGPTVIIFAATLLLPNVTLLTCHHCGHNQTFFKRFRTPIITEIKGSAVSLPVPKIGKKLPLSTTDGPTLKLK